MLTLMTALAVWDRVEDSGRSARLLRLIQTHAPRSLSTFTLLIALIGHPATVAAQQYCLSGTIVRISGHPDDRAFVVGDPVAVTATVQPGTLTCESDSVSENCDATLALQVQVGARSWASSTALMGSVNVRQ